MSPKFRLKLFVTAENAGQQESKVKYLLQEMQREDFSLEILDFTQANEQAQLMGISKAPALYIEKDDGTVRVIYSLDDSYAIRYALGLRRLW